MNWVKITYTTGGHKGWQYQNLNQEFTVVNPPMPGPVPFPAPASAANPHWNVNRRQSHGSRPDRPNSPAGLLPGQD